MHRTLPRSRTQTALLLAATILTVPTLFMAPAHAAPTCHTGSCVTYYTDASETTVLCRECCGSSNCDSYTPYYHAGIACCPLQE